ncbi:hypothetical protein ABZ669_07095 [Streptomyces hirsutus]|uniref:hypothetical protein n=1 Tax=Streptomyces hirsutus TaxID=35620 RepID=UPI0033D01863
MPKEYVSHAKCKHDDSKMARRECRTQRQHANCDHGSSRTERVLCTRRKNEAAKNARKK